MSDVDVVVIGSGAGGLAAAVALARAGKRVVVFEQHYLPGGWSHSFSLEGYPFSPGVHYIGQLQEGGSLRRLYEGLGLGPELEFYELNPDGFDHVTLGDERFSIPKGKQAFADRLCDRFPREARGIQGYLDAVEALNDELSTGLSKGGLLGLLTLPFRAPTLLRWAWRTGDAMIRAHVSDPVVRGILSAQSGDHGLPPSQVSAAVHAAITAHYFEGGWYPKGGAAALPRVHIRELKRNGGEIRVRAPVEEILLERGRAIGVRLGDGTEVRADVVISNADPGVTFERLIGRERLSSGLRKTLDGLTYSVSALSLFMAARLDPAVHGLDSGNQWLYAHPDVDGIYREGLEAWGPEVEDIPGMFLTVTTLKDPSRSYDGVHTMEAFCFVGYDAFRRWEASVTGERPEAYEEAKRQLEEKMLTALERRVPGLRDALVFSSLGTPLTNVHYCGATRGSLYGTAKLRSQVGPLGFGVHTEFDGLYLCGASTLSHGVAGAARSGVVAAGRALGCRTRELLDEDGAPITLRDAESERAAGLVASAG